MESGLTRIVVFAAIPVMVLAGDGLICRGPEWH